MGRDGSIHCLWVRNVDANFGKKLHQIWPENRSKNAIARSSASLWLKKRTKIAVSNQDVTVRVGGGCGCAWLLPPYRVERGLRVRVQRRLPWQAWRLAWRRLAWRRLAQGAAYEALSAPLARLAGMRGTLAALALRGACGAYSAATWRVRLA